MRVGRKLLGFVAIAVLTLVADRLSAYASEGAFVGVDLGVSEPATDKYRQHVRDGGTGAPYGGYMFNDYVGLLGQLHFNFQSVDVDGRKYRNVCPAGATYCVPGSNLGTINNESQWTTIFGMTVGPRFNVPLFNHLFDLHADVQGGGYKGLGGRLNQWAPGFWAGGGLDWNITPKFSIGGFGRWNRAYMSPHPYLLGQSFTTAAAPADQQGPADIQWAEAGVSLRYSFFEEKPAPAPPPPPPPPPAAAPVKKKIVLRAVHFDFNKYNIRRDAIPVLDEAVSVLKQEPSAVGVICAGYTDSIGTEQYNLKLSMRRADAVKNYLVSKGIPASRIKTEGFGESNPVASNDTAEGRAQNRRTELKLQ
jgi:outer membrane protein OmpA-like peptidoglycan-associated protein